VKERYTKVFEILSGEDKLMNKDDMETASRQLHSHVDTDSEEFKKALEELNPSAKTRYSLTEFLGFQAKLRHPPPEIEVALMNLREEEVLRFSEFYKQWRH
jgi:hypothetical protein